MGEIDTEGLTIGNGTRPINLRLVEGGGWPLPLPIVSTLPPVARFSSDLLPDDLRRYVFDVAERQQSPADFVAVAALCGLSAVVGNKVRVRPKHHDDWTITPNLWGALVGPPSAMKSPAMQAALAPAFMLQDEMRDLWEQRCAAMADDELLAGLEEKTAKANAMKLLKAGDRDGAKKLLKEASGEGDELPPCPRLIVNDATVEKLGELLNENRNGLLLIRDELPGFLARMEDQDCQGERAFYLEAFNGDGSFTFDRIGRGTVRIEVCTVSIIGGVQPSRIIPLVRGAVSGSSNDGLLQRLQMTVWPDANSSWRWVDRAPDACARLALDRIFRDVRDMPSAADGEPRIMRFAPEAQDAFREWMESIQKEARSKTLPSALESHILKLPKTVASLALIFDLIEGDGDDLIGDTAILRALSWADYLRTHANRLYAAGQTMAEEGARQIVERRRQLPELFTARDVHRKQWGGLTDRDAVASAIEILTATHHCRERSVSHSGAGRPTSAFDWNPRLANKEA
ncbi:YfjI family protein [Bosea sp. (in: a-proteobacteria)]|uniref:YfjI family protein n=1 Tax=Bosea sp. (in: a-proteobacteria) TaxID=1871050 RepID=UPI001AC627F4|nr:YfjI family protein [Bosea sp. (in: a-proteobacteria)]MBN9440704.1 DUF3987 domain-containing protein [Bosea sp. (in: a-proteobacteria)]